MVKRASNGIGGKALRLFEFVFDDVDDGGVHFVFSFYSFAVCVVVFLFDSPCRLSSVFYFIFLFFGKHRDMDQQARRK